MVAAGRNDSGLRIGQGVSSQRISSGKAAALAGMSVELQVGDASSDGDVASQAVLAALMTALSLPGIDTLFPADDTEALRENSLVLLSQTVSALKRRQLDSVSSASISLHLADWQAISAYWEEMCGMLASALQVERDCIGLGIGPVPDGMDGDCMYAVASVLCQRRNPFATAPKAAAPSRAERTAEAARSLFDNPQPARASEPEPDILEDPTLPRRAREFEQAVRSGLPPLPRAQAPEPGSTLYVYSDGASRGNPGKAATGFVVMDGAGLLVHEGGTRLEDCTNNQAEYRAIIEALEWVERELGHDFHLECRLDSELVVKQLKGEYKVKKEELKPLSMKAMNLLMYFTSFELRHVPRAENARADAMANAVLDNS
ncbi:MAG: 2-C-methyl-D-erythritol 2,4-cyclodiphosphate synthase [Planctomycetales bacterium]|nr:2-C-methyl-D-erythritol 2,4-cyclodiphosphate synthase [bacterium]UNM08488.1 MAG: 2-C-methyl-D-erythritol 2,4-cyclodiphosphate synthase [Planctomycetales bacterium]